MRTEWTPELRATVDRLISEGRNSAYIAEQINLTQQAVLSGRKRHNLGEMSPGRKPNIPPEIVQMWPTHSIRDIAEKTKRGRGTISRWGKMLGLPTKLVRDTTKARSFPKPKKTIRPGQGNTTGYIGHTYKPDRPTYDESQAGQAARYLQRYGAVYRCDQFGKANPAGKFWNRGGRVLSDADVIDRAAYFMRKDAA